MTKAQATAKAASVTVADLDAKIERGETKLGELKAQHAMATAKLADLQTKLSGARADAMLETDADQEAVTKLEGDVAVAARDVEKFNGLGAALKTKVEELRAERTAMVRGAERTLLGKEIATLETMSVKLDGLLGTVASEATAWLAQAQRTYAVGGASGTKRPREMVFEAMYRAFRTAAPELSEAFRSATSVPSAARSCSDFARYVKVRAEKSAAIAEQAG
jgi:hypothetical protein